MNTRAKFLITLIATILFSSVATAKTPGNWPQWRGPDSQGVSDETSLPSEWTTTKNVKWKTPIAGRGLLLRSCGVRKSF